MNKIKKVIYSKRFPQTDDIELEEAIQQSADNPKKKYIPEGESIIDYIEKNRKYVPNLRRIADKDKFINWVIALSEEYEIDADLKEYEGYYIADFYMCSASYTGYIKKMLDVIFLLADEFSLFPPKDDSYDVLFSFTYHTHDVYMKGMKITDLD